MAPGDVLRSIRRLDDLPRLTAALGFTPSWRELPARCFPGVESAAIVGHQGAFEWYGLDRCAPGACRRAARALAARGFTAAVLGLETNRRLLVAAAADAPGTTIALDAPEPLAVARLERCNARVGELPLATVARIAEALVGAGVDQRFFAGFRLTLAAVMGALPSRVPLADRHALALLQLTRILFLYFVEAKGWLGRPRFLREAVDQCLGEGRSLHRDLLNPLCFGTLNRPFEARGSLARRFGPLPFLNGGLFEPHPLERRWKVLLPTAVLRDAFDTLFERFHFTLGTAQGESIAPDMLGRVFEGVMEPEERHRTGSYYTPAALVDQLLREALAEWLRHSIGVSSAEARRRIGDPDPGTRRAFRGVRLLDPAVGSGAFLLGALQLLAGPDREPGARRAARLRGLLGRCLFGVDRNAAAVRLAELRLWLEVVAADPSERPTAVMPLPNLDALVRQGDSLVDPAAGLPLPPPERGRARELARLRAAVVGASGEAKRHATAALQRAERRVAEQSLEGALDRLGGTIAELLAVARDPTLFGEPRGLGPEERLRLATLRDQRSSARQQLRAVRRADEVPWFHYPTHFADVLCRGGFDLVVGNPPWVRAEALSRPLRSYLAERFRWFRGARSGRSGYAHQPDLAVAFLERALELAAPRGVVALLVPAKLATTGYASVARAELARRTTIVAAADLRNVPAAAFDATVYPMAMLLQPSPPPEGHRVRLALDPGAESVPQRELAGGPWALLGEPVRRTLARLSRALPLCAEHFTCQLGAKTGYDRAFLDPPADLEPELLRWAVRGRDVRQLRVQPVRRLLWPCDAAGHPLARLPPHAARHLERYGAELRRRADHHGGPWWRVFRTRAASARHRVVWADVSRRLEAAALSGAAGDEWIPLNTCYVIATPDSPTALRLAAWLNSTWCRAIAAATADPASSGFLRFNARVVGSLPCPSAVPSDGTLLELARAGSAGELPQEELDEHCARLLGLGAAERTALAAVARARAGPGR